MADNHHCHKEGETESHCKKGHDEKHHDEHHKEQAAGADHHCHKDGAAESHCKKGHDEKHHDEHHKEQAAGADHQCHKDGAAESHCKKEHDEKHHDEHHKEHEHHHHDHHEHGGHEHHHHHEDVKLKLYYFDARGRAELIRYILSYAKKPFEDVRFTKEEWPDVKKRFPASQLPVLEIEHCEKKVMLSQSLSIARHLAARFKLNGSTCIQAAQCDEVVDCLNDLINLAVLAFLEQDPTRRELIRNRLRDEEYPRILGYLEEKLKLNGGKHIVGDCWTYADLAIAVFLGGVQKRGADMERIKAQFPGLCDLAKSVDQIPEISAWIASRPPENAEM